MKTCPVCAQQIPDNTLRCPACRADLASAISASAQPPAPLPPPTAASSAGWPPPPGPPAQGAYVPAPDAKTSGMAVASVVFGAFGAFIPVVPSIVAIVLGHKSRTEIRNSLGKLKGDGLALAGLILGYSLLVIVMGVMLIAAIAIPNLLRAKMAANEATAVGSLRTINTACITYSTIYGAFPPSLGALGGMGNGAAPSATAAQLIDSALASGTKGGYSFSYSPGEKDASGNLISYTIIANPITPGVTGIRYFFTDESDAIRASQTGPANANSPPIE